MGIHRMNRINDYLQYDDHVDTAGAVNGHMNNIPMSIDDSGLTLSMLEDIVSRHLFEGGVMDLNQLATKTALASLLLENIISGMRADARVEVLGPAADSIAIRYNLTDNGRRFAREAKERSGYVGPAPISEQQYRQLIAEQSVHNLEVTRHQMHNAFSEVVIKPELMDQLGAAMHSGKAIFIYGHAGTGKTYLCSRLIKLLRTPVYIPHAVAVGDSIVRVFDPSVHSQQETTEQNSAWLAERPDSRLVLCDRPFISSGGELTMDQLEISHDQNSSQYIAPLHMKATHGIYMIDDLGRQKITVDELFNRWIVPMESGFDYLNFDSGSRLELPFDVILIFSTNLSPESLNDAAFQRRIGHKIRFDNCDVQSYSDIWRNECQRLGVYCDEDTLRFALQLHDINGVPMLASQPRDLIGLSLDYSRYAGLGNGFNSECLETAWKNFILDTDKTQ